LEQRASLRTWDKLVLLQLIAKEWIEEAAGQSLGAVICELICKPLELKSIELAETREQFSRLHWRAAAHYDPGWVYHGCLTGTAADAARLLHGLFNGDLLMPKRAS
jgi:D-alanyl-D-alanine carboxypeptidase